MADTDELHFNPEGLARRIEVLEKEMAGVREVLSRLSGVNAGNANNVPPGKGTDDVKRAELKKKGPMAIGRSALDLERLEQ